MWDAGLVTRVKDRKLNEILIFASMAKIDQENIDEYIDIIEMLGDDINGCDALLDTEGQAEIAVEAIESEEYRCRLSPNEAADEDAFNAMKVPPLYEQPDLDYVKQLITDAVESIRSESPCQADDAKVSELEAENSKNLKIILDLETERNELQLEVERLKKSLDAVSLEMDSLKDCSGSEISQCKEAMATLKEEIASLRTRNEQLSAQLDYAQESITTVESERDELRAAVAQLSEPPAQEPEEEPVTEPVVEAPAAEPAQEEPDVNAQEQDADNFDQVITDREKDMLARIVKMKSKKIDEFIDKAFSGEVSEDVSEDIVSFLKDDMRICELILAIDCSSFDGIVSGLRAVLDAVENSTESRFHKIYMKSLDEEDTLLEDNYVEILTDIHALISARYLPYVRGSVF